MITYSFAIFIKYKYRIISRRERERNAKIAENQQI